MDPKQKWNNKYKERLQKEGEVSPNERLTGLAPYFQGGTALDFACGLGTNSLFLANSGFTVKALDISEVAIEHLKQQENPFIDALVCDLTEKERLPLKDEFFDLVVISYYLDREILPFIKSVTKEGGMIFMETFYLSPEAKKEHVSDQFKLQPQELLTQFKGWHILFYEENEKEGRQTILARKK